MRVIYKDTHDRTLATIKADAIPEMGETVFLTTNGDTIKFIAQNREFHVIVDNGSETVVVIYLGAGEFHY